MRSIWFSFGVVIGLSLVSSSFGAIPKKASPAGPPAKNVVTDDTALYEGLSEIQVPKEARPSFDGDVARLATQEARFRDRLPQAPIRRVQEQKYQFSGRPASAPSPAAAPEQRAGRVAR